MTTGTVGSTARQLPLQVVHYLRKEVNFDDSGIGTADSVEIGILPAGAIIIGTDVHVETVFNAGTTNVLTAGTSAGSNADVVAAGDVNEAATGLTQNVAPTSAALGPLAADVTIYAKYTQSGTAATTGKAQIIVKYVVDNDG